MPNFNFKSQFPIADVIAAAQKKPQIEAQIQATQEEARNARFKTLLDALSTGAQAARLMSQNKTEALAQQQAKSQMAGQRDLQSILTEPQQQAPVAAPIQQFRPIQPAGPATAEGGLPPPVMEPSGAVQPTFGQTPQGASQPGRLSAALVQAFPQAAGDAMTKQQFADPVERQYKQAQIANIGVDNQLNATKILDERAKTAAAAGVDQAKLDIDRQKLAIEREKLKMEALNNGTKLTDVQANALLFGERAAKAHELVDELMMEKTDPTTGQKTPGLDAGSIGTGVERMLPNMMQSEDVQKLEQAKLDFIYAILRRESGAAISNGEIKGAMKQYFPSTGDTASVIQQKARNRETAIAGILRAGGKQGETLLAQYRGTSGGSPGLPHVGSTFNGGKVLKVEKVQ